jgi:hypothetical protein
VCQVQSLARLQCVKYSQDWTGIFTPDLSGHFLFSLFLLSWVLVSVFRFAIVYVLCVHCVLLVLER